MSMDWSNVIAIRASSYCLRRRSFVHSASATARRRLSAKRRELAQNEDRKSHAKLNVASLANNVRATVSGIQMQQLVMPASSQRAKKRKQEKPIEASSSKVRQARPEIFNLCHNQSRVCVTGNREIVLSCTWNPGKQRRQVHEAVNLPRRQNANNTVDGKPDLRSFTDDLSPTCFFLFSETEDLPFIRC
jgi:hypothetical protein